MKLKQIAFSLACVAAALPAQAQSAKDFEELRMEMQKLRAELDALKKERAMPAMQAAPSADLSDRVEAIEIRAKDAVTLGDIPGSFRLPNSETSLRLYGFAELNMVHDFKGDNTDIDYAS